MECCKNKHEEGCCRDLNLNDEMKGGKTKMDENKRRIWLWAVIGVLFIAALFLIFQAGSVQSASTAANAAGSVVKSTATASSGMVGGC